MAVLDCLRCKKDGDGKYDHEGGEDSAERCHDTTLQTLEPVADGGGDVDCENTRKRLCDGEQVEKLIAFDPMLLVDDLLLDDRDHGPSSSESEGSDF